MKFKDALKISGIPVVVASLCCLSPVILVALGLASVAFGASLADIFYGQYKWAFRGAGLLGLAVAIVVYLRRTAGICTLNEAVRRRNEIINIVALSLTVSVAGYIFFLYVVVEYAGKFLHLWE